ncbi:uncharacterized protein LOC144582454 [Callithrix jacchus]
MLRSLGRLGLRGDCSGSGAGRRERGGRLGGRGGGSGGPRRGGGTRSRGRAGPGGGRAGRRCPVGSPGSHGGDPRPRLRGHCCCEFDKVDITCSPSRAARAVWACSHDSCKVLRVQEQNHAIISATILLVKASHRPAQIQEVRKQTFSGDGLGDKEYLTETVPWSYCVLC